MIRIHISGDSTEAYRDRVIEIASRIARKATGNEIITIVKRQGVNMQVIHALEDQWVKLVVCGVDAVVPVPMKSAVNYVDMSRPESRSGRQQTFDSIESLEVYLIRKADRIFAVGSREFCEGLRIQIDELNAALPGISHKKLIISLLGGDE